MNIFNRKSMLIASKLLFRRTDVVTISPGHEEVSDREHNTHNGLINTLDEGKTKCLPDVLLKSA